MAGEQATSPAVDGSLGTALLSSESRLAELESNGLRIGAVLKSTTQEAVRLGTEFKASQEGAVQSAKQWLTSLGNIFTNLTNQIDAVKTLTGLYQNLGKAMEAGQLSPVSLQAPDHGATVISASESLLGATGKALGNSNDYRQVINEITALANLLPATAEAAASENPDPSEKDRRDKVDSISVTIAEIRKQSGMDDTQSAGVMRDMLNAGIDFSSLKDLAPLAAKFSVGMSIDPKDTAAMFRSMKNNDVKDSEIGAVLNALVDQARNGGTVSVSDIVQMMPRLAAAMSAKGQKGADGIILAGQIAQERGAGHGTSLQISSDAVNQISEKPLPAVKGRVSTIDYVEKEAQAFRETPGQQQAELGNAATSLSATLGNALQPYVEPFVSGLTQVTLGADQWAKANEKVVGHVMVLGVGIASAAALFGVLRKGREIFEATKGLFSKKKDGEQSGGFFSRLMGNGAPSGKAGVIPVFVINMPRNFASRNGPGEILRVGRGQPPVPPKGYPQPGGAYRPTSVWGPQPGLSVSGTGTGPLAGGASSGRSAGTNVPQGAAYNASSEQAEKRPVPLAGSQQQPMPSNGGLQPGGAYRTTSVTGTQPGLSVAGTGFRPLGGTGVPALSPGANVALGTAYNASSAQAGKPVTSLAGDQHYGAGSYKAAQGAPTLSPPTPPPSAQAPRNGWFSKVRSVGKGLGRFVPGGRVVDAGLTLLDVFTSKGTRNEKVQGITQAAGGLGGSMAGAAAGAALGSVVPVVGTVLGGLIGAALGSMAGEAAGGRVGKALQTKDGPPARRGTGRGGAVLDIATGVVSAVVIDGVNTRLSSGGPQEAEVSPSAEAQTPSGEGEGKVLPVSMTNSSPTQFAVSPNITINVQGIITNPAELVSVLQPEIQRMFTGFAAQANANSQTWDQAAAGYTV